MIRSYLRYIEMIEMISRRLTQTQKAEILDAYIAGVNTNFLAEKYNCTPNTVNRTVKNLLSEDEYKLLKKNRAKNSNKIEKFGNYKNLEEVKESLDQVNELISSKENTKKEDLNLKDNEVSKGSEFNEITPLTFDEDDDFIQDLSSENENIRNHNIDKNIENFEVIEPLISDFDFDSENQKSDFEILNYDSLPESVFMIVDKKVELELQPISTLPEWSFLPENELKRNAILLFVNQRAAKRICSRNQRVIKIPNTSVFEISKPYLISKGITRLILEDSIIALDDE